MRNESISKIHFIAVCGTAMGSLAGMLKSRGYEVTGSDEHFYPPMGDLIRKWGVHVMQGFDASHLDDKPDLVIVGNMCRRDNPECVRMRELSLPHMSMPEALDHFFLKDKTSIVISGTHGKTTTSSLTSWLLESAGRDPSFMIGGIPGNFGANFKLGGGPHFVVEGDEYDTAYFDKGPKFLHYEPKVALITSIEFDHADIYRSIDDYKEAFSRFVQLIPVDGHLVCYDEDDHIRDVISGIECRLYSYGFSKRATWQIGDVTADSSGTTFRIFREGEDLGLFSVPLWGNHNVLNAAAAYALAYYATHLSAGEVRTGFASFKGIRRRQEIIVNRNEIIIIDDFAHHPTAVRETIKSVRSRFPHRRLVACFEAESNTSRRRIFQEDYGHALGFADVAVLAKPLKKKDNLSTVEQIDVMQIVADLKARGVDAYHIPDAPDIAAFLKATLRSNDVCLLMSGRDFQGLPQMLRDLYQDALQPES